MALINQKGMYQGSAALNPLPYVQIAMQARAKKAAREEALDKYYSDLPYKINDKGLRAEELPGIEQGKNDLYATYLRDKDLIKKGDAAALANINRKFTKLQLDANKGLAATKSDLETGKVWMNKDNQWLLNNPDFVKDLAKSHNPSTSEEYAPVDYSKWLNLKPIDITELSKDLSSKIKWTEEVLPAVPHPNDPNLEVLSTKPLLNKENKDFLYNYSTELFHSKPNIARKINEIVNDPAQFSKMNGISQMVLGHPIRDEVKLEDLTTAYMASILPVTQSTRPKVVNNQEEDWKKKLAFNAITDRQKKQNINLYNCHRENCRITFFIRLRYYS